MFYLEALGIEVCEGFVMLLSFIVSHSLSSGFQRFVYRLTPSSEDSEYTLP